MTPLVACLALFAIACLVIALALYLKGDVKAILRVSFLAFSLEAKDKTKPQ